MICLSSHLSRIISLRIIAVRSKPFVPIMMQRNYGRVINVSSGGGSFGEGLGPAAYAVSKAALNALTVKVAQAAQGDVKVNAMCPGWVRTDIGGIQRSSLVRGGRGQFGLARDPCGRRSQWWLFPGPEAYPLVGEIEVVTMQWFRRSAVGDQTIPC